MVVLLDVAKKGGANAEDGGNGCAVGRGDEGGRCDEDEKDALVPLKWMMRLVEVKAR